MVVFDISETRGPWVIFGPRDPGAFREQLAALEVKGGGIHHFQAKDLLDGAWIFRTFAEKLQFPGYFGWNWDAMVDCLDGLCGTVTAVAPE